MGGGPPLKACISYGEGAGDSLGATLLNEGGWHFSYFNPSLESVLGKLDAFSHEEFNTEEERGRITDNIADILGRGLDVFDRKGEELAYVPTWELELPATAGRFTHFFPRPLKPKVAKEWRETFLPVPLSTMGPQYVHGPGVGGRSKSCGWSGTDVDGADYVIGVISAVNNAERRNTLRRTWLNHPRMEGYEYEYAFFLGLAEDGTIPREVVDEMNEFHDIVVVNVRDTYKNMIHKVVSVFSWGVSCKASYVFRVNDDVYLRFEPVFKLLETIVPTRTYVGYFMEGVKVLRPSQEWNKTYEKSSQVSKSEYPSEVYPSFAQGNAYGLSGDMAEEIAGLSR